MFDHVRSFMFNIPGKSLMLDFTTEQYTLLRLILLTRRIHRNPS